VRRRLNPLFIIEVSPQLFKGLYSVFLDLSLIIPRSEYVLGRDSGCLGILSVRRLFSQTLPSVVLGVCLRLIVIPLLCRPEAVAIK
jgi:hypothetical protein